MLCLGRKEQEQVILIVPPSDVEQTIEVMVVRITSDNVRLGFQADKEVEIYREELGRQCH